MRGEHAVGKNADAPALSTRPRHQPPPRLRRKRPADPIRKTGYGVNAPFCPSKCGLSWILTAAIACLRFAARERYGVLAHRIPLSAEFPPSPGEALSRRGESNAEAPLSKLPPRRLRPAEAPT
jgi:hypothetical protein